jgi:hypothetical protein
MKSVHLVVRRRNESEDPPFFPVKLNAKTPIVIKTTLRYCKGWYLMSFTNKLPIMAGNNLQDLARACVG